MIRCACWMYSICNNCNTQSLSIFGVRFPCLDLHNSSLGLLAKLSFEAFHNPALNLCNSSRSHPGSQMPHSQSVLWRTLPLRGSFENQLDWIAVICRGFCSIVVVSQNSGAEWNSILTLHDFWTILLPRPSIPFLFWCRYWKTPVFPCLWRQVSWRHSRILTTTKWSPGTRNVSSWATQPQPKSFWLERPK